MACACQLSARETAKDGGESGTQPLYAALSPEQKIQNLEDQLRREGDEEGLAALQTHRRTLLNELDTGSTRCLGYFGQPSPERIRSAADVVRAMGPQNPDQEEFWVLLLSGQAEVLAKVLVAKGTLSEVKVVLRDVFREAVRQNAAGLILYHNHPGGSLSPSADDELLTVKAEQAGRMLGIWVLDHIIVSAGGIYSFADADNIGNHRKHTVRAR